jgi:hypothetical protein
MTSHSSHHLLSHRGDILYTVVTLLPRLGIYSLCIQPASEGGHIFIIHTATKTKNIFTVLPEAGNIFTKLPEAGNIFTRLPEAGNIHIIHIHPAT